jgi:hypothetical protein
MSEKTSSSGDRFEKSIPEMIMTRDGRPLSPEKAVEEIVKGDLHVRDLMVDSTKRGLIADAVKDTVRNNRMISDRVQGKSSESVEYQSVRSDEYYNLGYKRQVKLAGDIKPKDIENMQKRNPGEFLRFSKDHPEKVVNKWGTRLNQKELEGAREVARQSFKKQNPNGIDGQSDSVSSQSSNTITDQELQYYNELTQGELTEKELGRYIRDVKGL